jgi:phosphopantothenoylcysteine decarboxylase/phosphopantothenate--cysteine ligase
VRFISNPSSGKMGYAVAGEALQRGHGVDLVSGPVCLSPPEGVRFSSFESVEELYDALRSVLPGADCLVMTAAVGDYSPERRISGKHKKEASLKLELTATRDVLASLAPAKGRCIFVGFALEVENALENARRKVENKSLDLLVLNSPSSFASEKGEFTLVFADGSSKGLGEIPKARLAAVLLDEVERLFGAREGG